MRLSGSGFAHRRPTTCRKSTDAVKPPAALLECAARERRGLKMSIIYTVIAILIGIGLYTLRCRKLFVYGVFEVLLSILVIYLSIDQPWSPGSGVIRGSAFFGFGRVGYLLQNYWAKLAGIYIFVRGMDNMGAELPDCMRRWWHRLFFGKCRSNPAANAASEAKP
jgi:hypothetical protein